MTRLRSSLAAAILVALTVNGGDARAGSLINPLLFFEGATESVGTLSILMQKPKETRSRGVGTIAPNGSLNLVQRVADAGRAPYIRRWAVYQVGPGRFSGTMSEATGPVTIEQVGDRFRFRFAMKGTLLVEEWLTPLAGARSATNELTVRRFGLKVASYRGMIRKID